MHASAQARVARLERVFSHIGATRMLDVPVLNTSLQVQAVGFELADEAEAQILQGILITPWFMNLVRLPLLATELPASGSDVASHEPGSKHSYVLGGNSLEFILAHEAELGYFEACSLFSPMFEFADQEGAVATATEILRLLRETPAPETASGLEMPARRGFLLGRSSKTSKISPAP